MTQEERTPQALERIADALELIAGITEDDTQQAPISRLADLIDEVIVRTRPLFQGDTGETYLQIGKVND